MSTVLSFEHVQSPDLPLPLNWSVEEGKVALFLSEDPRPVWALRRALLQLPPQHPACKVRRYGQPLQALDLSRIGFLLAYPLEPRKQVVGRLLKAYADALGLNADLAMESLPAELQLPFLAERRVAELSSGESRQVQLAMALLAHPSMLWLEGLFNGLNDSETRRLRLVLQNLAQRPGLTIILFSDRLNLDLQLSTEIDLWDNHGCLHHFQSDRLDAQQPAWLDLQLPGEDMPAACRVLEELGETDYLVLAKDHLRILRHPERAGEFNRALNAAGLTVQLLAEGRQPRAEFFRRFLEGKNQ